MGKRRWDAMKRETFLRRHISELTDDIALFRASPTGMTALSKARDQLSRAHLELTDLLAAQAAEAEAAEDEMSPDEAYAELVALARATFTHQQQRGLYDAMAEQLGLAPHLRVVE